MTQADQVGYACMVYASENDGHFTLPPTPQEAAHALAPYTGGLVSYDTVESYTWNRKLAGIYISDIQNCQDIWMFYTPPEPTRGSRVIEFFDGRSRIVNEKRLKEILAKKVVMKNGVQ